MKGERNSYIPCIYNPNLVCDCRLKSGNAKLLNEWGNNARGLRSEIQRQGYDKVSPGLIRNLLVNPNGGYYTEALERVLSFSPGMLIIRERLISRWKNMIMKVSDYDLDEIPCPNFREDLLNPKE